MSLKKLYLHHFRNYTEAELTFSPGVNWIVGENAQGKTNLLEAISLLCTGRSFRTQQLGHLIQKGASFFYLEAEFEKEGVNQSLKLSFDGEIKKMQYNGNRYSHFTPLIGLLPHILYAPEDIALVGGAPASRRKFLDLHLSQVNPLYLHHLARYHKAMRQRNELLKKKTEETIDAWEEMMAYSAEYLMQKRQEMILQLKSPLDECMKALSKGADSLKIGFQGSLPHPEKQDLLKHWQENRKKELHIGKTLYGPHRDDVSFLVQGLSAKSFASEGQKHCVIAALRLCQWDHLYRQTGHSPLMSIDDFGAHLDQSRQIFFTEKLSNLGQIFLTSPNVAEEIFPDKHLIKIDSGKVLEVGCS